jgi:acyl-CoA synthetase (AMP-forming)/AMP-acid ligase II
VIVRCIHEFVRHLARGNEDIEPRPPSEALVKRDIEVAGDRARQLADGSVELHGRDSVTINSGGEKIFAEEVEHALKAHPDVYDAVVAGRPSERWGSEVVGIVRLKPGSSVSAAALIQALDGHLARYKLPKDIVFRDEIVRSPSGKADYRWAREQALAG